MIVIPGNVRVWLATGHTDMRRGFPSLARLVQESLKRNPHAGDLFVFRGRRLASPRPIFSKTLRLHWLLWLRSNMPHAARNGLV